MLKKLLNRIGTARRATTNFEKKDYLDAYRKHTDYRVESNPKEAIGGLWDEIGDLQYRFLIDQGLEPHNNLLDYGCGTLRGGRLFIRFLDTAKYTGVDISRNAIKRARQFAHKERLEGKKPRLIWNSSASLDFSEIGSQKFDFIIAQSVFTHLLPSHIETCVSNLHRILQKDGRFYFTNFDAPEFTRRGLKDFSHPPDFFRTLADAHGFELTNLSDSYIHPRGQSMYRLSLRDLL